VGWDEKSTPAKNREIKTFQGEYEPSPIRYDVIIFDIYLILFN